jgi:hypothetical protein
MEVFRLYTFIEEKVICQVNALAQEWGVVQTLDDLRLLTMFDTDEAIQLKVAQIEQEVYGEGYRLMEGLMSEATDADNAEAFDAAAHWLDQWKVILEAAAGGNHDDASIFQTAGRESAMMRQPVAAMSN